jgi:hypothetical protein
MLHRIEEYVKVESYILHWQSLILDQRYIGSECKKVKYYMKLY